MPAPWSILLCDSLEKIFADTKPRPMNTQIPLAGIRGEAVSFQVAIHPPRPYHQIDGPRVRIEVEAGDGVVAQVHSVDLVPVTVPCSDTPDDGYLRTTAGLYPDLLTPVASGEIRPVPGQWRAAWINLHISSVPEVDHVTVRVWAGGAEPEASVEVPIVFFDAALPDLPIPHTHWFHCDGLASYYGDEVFSDEHWDSIDAFLGAARGVGTTMILTPVWTPPLDTAIGTYRVPTQLVAVTEPSPGVFAFDWTRVHRWLDLCATHGFTYLEMPHLFTQWGAGHAPAIYVDSPTGPTLRFGWHTDATDPQYRRFLEQLLPELITVVSARWDIDRVFFHISDEPTPEHLPSYRAAHHQVGDLLENRNVIDAISDLELFQPSLVPIPVVATDHAEPFLDAGAPMWLYYCVVQDTEVSNRFCALPSPRNRVIGAQLYTSGAQGFLHWGFNFYNAHHSTHAIDPFRDTCAGGGFFGGDSFLVYPGAGRTPLTSIRYEVFREAMLDLRLMYFLEEHLGADAVRKLVDQNGQLTLRSFSGDADHYRRVAVDLIHAAKSV